MQSVRDRASNIGDLFITEGYLEAEREREREGIRVINIL